MQTVANLYRLRNVQMNQEFRHNGELCHLVQKKDARRIKGSTDLECLISDRLGNQQWINWNTEVEVMPKAICAGVVCRCGEAGRMCPMHGTTAS